MVTVLEISTTNMRSVAGRLHDESVRAAQIAASARGTMSGNVYGIFTPIFSPSYTAMVEMFDDNARAIGQSLDDGAEALELSAESFENLEASLVEAFEAVADRLESLD